MRTDAEVAEYFEAARGWDFDRAQAERRSARRAWVIAAVATAVALTAVVAVAALTPLKSVQPFVIRVDNATGVVDVVPVLKGKVAESEAVTRYLITQYVITRERYVPALAEADYETIGAFHTPRAEPGLGGALEPHQSRVAAQPARRWQQRAGAGDGGVVSVAGQRSA